MTHPDSVKLEEAIRTRLRSTVDGQFRLLPRGMLEDDAESRLEALWDRLVMEGPGVEMVRTIVDAYDGFMAQARRREDLWRRVSSVINDADDTRLSSLEQLVTMFEALPIPLVADDDIVDVEIVDESDCNCGARPGEPNAGLSHLPNCPVVHR